MHGAEGALQNRNPAIERMAAILSELAKTQGGLGLKELSTRADVTRSSAYRILNSLLAHGYVRQLESSLYILGPQLLELADGVAMPSGGRVARAAQPHLEIISRSLGETSKVSIYDRGHVVVVAVAPGNQGHALHARVGEQLPIHAGGGSKSLLAYLPQDVRERIYSRPLTQFNERTLIEPEALETELARIRDQGWSRDHGEFSASVNSYGAPIRDRSGQVVAAISIPFLAGRDAEYELLVRTTVVEAARRIGNDLPKDLVLGPA